MRLLACLRVLVVMEKGSSSGVQGLEEAWESFRFEDEDQGDMEVPIQEAKQVPSETKDIRYRLVGRFLTEKLIILWR